MHVGLRKFLHGEATCTPDSQMRHLYLPSGSLLATIGLVWFAYVATREWRRGTDLLQQRRSPKPSRLHTGPSSET